MLVPQIWIKKEPSGLVQVGFLIETQVVATYAEDLRLAAIWWPYGRAVIGNKLQVCLTCFKKSFSKNFRFILEFNKSNIAVPKTLPAVPRIIIRVF